MSDLLTVASARRAERFRARATPVRTLDERLTFAVVCSLTACTLIVAVTLAGLLAKTPAGDRTKAIATFGRVA